LIARARLPLWSTGVVFLSIACSYLLVWPVGEYLVDDDWIFTRSLYYLAEEGRLRILAYNPMSLVGHLAWGALFTSVFGFGFTQAKLSTAVLLFVECLALRALLRRAGAAETTALLATLAVVFSPVHFFQSFLFATDVPTLAWSTLALLFYAKGFAESGPRSYRALLVAALCVSWAWTIRQGAIVGAAAPALYLLLFDRARLRDPKTLMASFGPPAIAVLGFQYWYLFVHGPTASYQISTRNILGFLDGVNAQTLLGAGYALGCYLAFFLLPVLLAAGLPAVRALRGPRRALWLVSWGGIAAGFLWFNLWLGMLFPYIRNKITRFGYLSPNEVIVGAREPLWGDGVAWLWSILLVIGLGLLVARWIAGPEPQAETPETHGGRERKVTLRLAAVLLGLQLVYAFLTIGILFDRHLIALIPAAMVAFVGCLTPGSRLRLVPYTLCLLPLAFYSIAGTHDVHAFSRAAATAGRALIEEGIDPQRIDAGFAFDGWHMYERSWRGDETGRPRHFARSGEGDEHLDANWVQDLAPGILTQYVVSLSPRMQPRRWRPALSHWAVELPQPRLGLYRVVDQHPYFRYWPWGEAAVYTLVDRSLEEPAR
jgi:hypothetical protein